MTEAEHDIVETVWFGKGISGSAFRNAGEKKLTLVAVLSKVRPFKTKAFAFVHLCKFRIFNHCTPFCKQ